MTKQEKLELIYICSHSIAWIKSNLENFPGDREEMLKDLRIKEIALASLTAQPVKLPAPIGVFMFTSYVKKALDEAGIKFEVEE